jgi:hypothetical protein
VGWRRRTRTLWVATLDRQMAQSEAIQRVIAAGERNPRVRSAERIVDPSSEQGVWEIVLSVGRRRTARGR